MVLVQDKCVDKIGSSSGMELGVRNPFIPSFSSTNQASTLSSSYHHCPGHCLSSAAVLCSPFVHWLCQHPQNSGKLLLVTNFRLIQSCSFQILLQLFPTLAPILLEGSSCPKLWLKTSDFGYYLPSNRQIWLDYDNSRMNINKLCISVYAPTLNFYSSIVYSLMNLCINFFKIRLHFRI